MEKISERSKLARHINTLKESGKTIGFANGCFDLIHVGHIRYLKDSKDHCDMLVVALNTDESVKKLKGAGRPHVPLDERMEILEALECVDFITWFDEDTVEESLRILKPHIQFKGTDYTPETVPERHIMAEIGGIVMITGDPKDHSTTALLEQMKDNEH